MTEYNAMNVIMESIKKYFFSSNRLQIAGDNCLCVLCNLQLYSHIYTVDFNKSSNFLFCKDSKFGIKNASCLNLSCDRIFIYIYIYIYIHTYLHVYIYTHTHTHTYTYIYIYIYTTVPSCLLQVTFVVVDSLHGIPNWTCYSIYGRFTIHT